MSLVERLEKLAKELDQQRWRNGMYDVDKADQSDLIAGAAKFIRGQERWYLGLVEQASNVEVSLGELNKANESLERTLNG